MADSPRPHLIRKPPKVFEGRFLFLRLDIFVENQVIVEIKSVSGIAPIHEAQLLSYLKMSDYKRGLLINFNVTMLKDGLRRMRL